jgi:hypothetical protein
MRRSGVGQQVVIATSLPFAAVDALAEDLHLSVARFDTRILGLEADS